MSYSRKNIISTCERESRSTGTLCSMRYALCGLILLLSAAAFYALLPRLISQAHYLRAKNDNRAGFYGLAISHLEKAHDYQPRDSEILKQLGEAYYKLGERRPMVRKAFRYIRKAKGAYLKAASLNPLDIEISYRLAKTEFRLERIYQYLYPEEKDTPYDALPYFKRTIHLRPNGILYHYALIRYLHHHNNTGELLQAVRSLSKIYPPASHYLKREPLWSPTVKEAVKEGLREAIQEAISIRGAHKALSSLLAHDKEWNGAISHYRKSLFHRKFDNTSENYIHLGRLYLQSGQREAAEAIFFQALDMSDEKEKDLQAFYSVYKHEGFLDELYSFYQKVADRFMLSPRIDILMARALIDSQRYNLAQRILTEVSHQEPNAEAYYWLARIAEIEKDWDRMELAIQKATVLDQNNSHYRQIFYGLLKRLGNLKAAEKEIGLRIRNSDSPSPGLFNERARIRWNRKDYQGAIDDWKSAIQLAPRKASFHAQAAEAYIKLGDWTKALNYYQKAVKLEPGNQRYTKRYIELKAGSS